MHFDAPPSSKYFVTCILNTFEGAVFCTCILNTFWLGTCTGTQNTLKNILPITARGRAPTFTTWGKQETHQVTKVYCPPQKRSPK